MRIDSVENWNDEYSSGNLDVLVQDVKMREGIYGTPKSIVMLMLIKYNIRIRRGGFIGRAQPEPVWTPKNRNLCPGGHRRAVGLPAVNPLILGEKDTMPSRHYREARLGQRVDVL